jgi:hypothetical protein
MSSGKYRLYVTPALTVSNSVFCRPVLGKILSADRLLPAQEFPLARERNFVLKFK